MNPLIWSIVLDALTLVPLILLGNKRRIGWIFYVGMMFLWIVFALDTGTYGFIPGAIVYGILYMRNWRKWNENTITDRSGDIRPTGEIDSSTR